MRLTEQREGLRMLKLRDTLGRFEAAELSQLEVAELLGMSERTFRRWVRRFEEEGEDGVLDRRLGRRSGRADPSRTGTRPVRRRAHCGLFARSARPLQADVLHPSGSFAQWSWRPPGLRTISTPPTHSSAMFTCRAMTPVLPGHRREGLGLRAGRRGAMARRPPAFRKSAPAPQQHGRLEWAPPANPQAPGARPFRARQGARLRISRRRARHFSRPALPRAPTGRRANRRNRHCLLRVPRFRAGASLRTAWTSCACPPRP
jgi:hypothetical protein